MVHAIDKTQKMSWNFVLGPCPYESYREARS
jgi:hypothetical protein